jgi:hypothetical protein
MEKVGRAVQEDDPVKLPVAAHDHDWISAHHLHLCSAQESQMRCASW